MKKLISVEYEVYQVEDLSGVDQDLIEAARESCESAYAPYSKFQVGASLRLNSGQIVTGSNQENIAYPSGLCAERVALFYAGANYSNEQIMDLCVVAEGDLIEKDQHLSPCGGCRQVMCESEKRQGHSIRVLLVNQDGTVSIFKSASDLLPVTFGK